MIRSDRQSQADSGFGTNEPKTFSRVIGVDFSGAAQSGKTAWLAEMVSPRGLLVNDTDPRLQLVSLQPLGKLAGADARESVNAYLVDRISEASETFWGCDFPFGLPIELKLGGWKRQLASIRTFSGDAKSFGRWLVQRTESGLGKKHVRRTTDRETLTPFDCYHYRIIYQTFHGMRDVLDPVAKIDSVAVLPFDYRRWQSGAAGSVVVEACPSSTLKRLALPHQRYKQSGGKPPESIHQQTRRTILKCISRWVDFSTHRRRVMMSDPGGDALDAVLVGLGGWLGFASADHAAIAAHKRYPREGRVYC
ncbi:MAG: DUF429 domain-containing protein [Planctomycetota bacterium]